MYAVITGASKGIGKAVAERLAAEGFDIAICARHAGTLKAAEADVMAKRAGVRVLAEVTDMSVKEAVLAFGRKVLDTFGEPPAILVNNAGIFTPGKVHEE